LEIGAGIGTLTNQFIPRDLYLASDINPHFLGYLSAYSIGKPYLEVAKIDAGIVADFAGLEGRFDTALAVNVLEHVDDAHQAMLSLHRSLAAGGRVVLIVPQYAWLYGAIDEVADHKLRYSKSGLRKTIEDAGFAVEVMKDFNRFSLPAWWVNGKLLKRTNFSRVQLKALDTAMPLLRRIDSRLPWGGQSLLAVGRKI
jgi:SAM-dependent methyltransferase